MFVCVYVYITNPFTHVYKCTSVVIRMFVCSGVLVLSQTKIAVR